MVFIKATFVKVKNFCVKHWKALLALLLIAVGYFLGRKSNVKSIEKSDLESTKTALQDQIDDIEELHANHNKEQNELAEERENKIRKVEENKKDNVELLSNNSKKLDNILRSEHNLKKGG